MIVRALALLGLALAAQDEIAQLPKYQRRYVERPLTISSDTFGVYGTLGFGALTREYTVVGLGAGVDYGIDEDLMVSLLLIRLEMSKAPDTGLSNPELGFTYRLLSGLFEVGGSASATIPVSGAFETRLAIPMLIRLPPILRIDLSPGFGMRSDNGWVFAAGVPAALTLQIVEPLALSAVAQVGLRNLKQGDTLLTLGGRIAYTFGKQGRAVVDLSLVVLGPALALTGDVPPEPSYDRFPSGSLELRWFSVDDYEGPDWSEDI